MIHCNFSDLVYETRQHKALNRILNRTGTELFEKIKSSDFLIADGTETHRLVGLSYAEEKMRAPKVTVICMRNEIPFAKKYAFVLGKEIVKENWYSAELLKNYAEGEELRLSEFKPAVRLYCDFELGKLRKHRSWDEDFYEKEDH